MQEMIEPDRTILIVSVVGLIVIWGSVAYHKFVQDSAPAVDDDADSALNESTEAEPPTQAAPTDQASKGGKSAAGDKGGRKHKKGGKGR